MEKYIESHLPESFASAVHEQVKLHIKAGQSFTLIGMPAVGVSPFLKFLCGQDYANFVHIDIYELAEYSITAFLAQLFFKLSGEKKAQVTFEDCKRLLIEKLQKEKRIVLVINKFDLLYREFSESFFAHFRTITHGTEGRVSFLFSVTTPYIDYNAKAIAGTNMYIFSRYVYFKPYQKADLYSLMKLHSPELLTHQLLSHAELLSGNHIQLLQLILRSDTPNNLLRDPYMRVLFEQIVGSLSKDKQRTLKKIAERKKVGEDHFLEHLGLVISKNGQYTVFSPLFQSYLVEKKVHRFSKKERLLFQLFRSNQGKILSKKRIFDVVWQNEEEGATDWALDSLLYRLRRHPYVSEKRYEIISHKKLGYQLVKEK